MVDHIYEYSLDSKDKTLDCELAYKISLPRSFIIHL